MNIYITELEFMIMIVKAKYLNKANLNTTLSKEDRIIKQNIKFINQIGYAQIAIITNFIKIFKKLIKVFFKMDTNKLMDDLQKCNNEKEMKGVFKNHFANKDEREKMWKLMKTYMNNQEAINNEDEKTLDDINNSINEIVDLKNKE